MKMHAKICILCTVHPALDDRVFFKQAKTLVQSGYDVTLIAQHERDEVVDGVRIIALPKPRNRFTRIFGLTWQAFRLALHQPADIYHFHDPELLSIGVLLKLLTRGRVIYDVHEDVPADILTKDWMPSPLRRLVSLIFNMIEKFLSRKMDGVVVATEGIAEKFDELEPVVVHNYPDLQMFPNPSPAPREGKEKVLVYVGGISKLRGAVEMVRALEYLAHIDNLRLDLIGKFESQRLDQELQASPGYRHVRFLGWLPRVEALAHARAADIGLVLFLPAPNHGRSLPIKLFEYMASRLPVVASNFPLWREIVEGNNCGLCVDPLDPKAIAQAIEYLIKHPEEARRKGENGRRAVEEKYNWEKESEKLLAEYQSLLETVPGRSGG